MTMGKITKSIRILVKTTLALVSNKLRRFRYFFDPKYSQRLNEYLKEFWRNLKKTNLSQSGITKDPHILPPTQTSDIGASQCFFPTTGNFIRRNHQYRRLRTRVAGSNIFESLKSSSKSRKLLDCIITRVVKAVEAEIGFIATFDPRKDQFTLWGQTNLYTGAFATAEYKSIRSCVNRAHESNQMVFRLANTGRIRSLVCIPITSFNRSFLCLVLANKKTDIAFSCQDVRKAEVIAENMICALHLHLRYEPKSLAAITSLNNLRCQSN